MRYSNEAVVVHNRGLGRALVRLAFGALLVNLVAWSMLDLFEGRLIHGAGQALADGLIVQALR